MKVKEIMTKDVVGINPDVDAQEALALLFSKKISGLPVIDAQGKLMGMFTEKDILSYILPGYIEKVGRFVYEEDPKSATKKFAELNKVKVSQLMRKLVVTTTEDATLCEVARVMLTQKARRIPVLDKAGRMSGIVARCDILRALAKETAAPLE
ncbi:MAG: CBS domain-containing protein [Candidatus Omnitrophota bacterium]